MINLSLYVSTIFTMSCQNNQTSCCGCSTSNNNTAHEQIFSEHHQSLYKSTYHLAKMDCSAEEQMVRMVLADIPQIQTLQFNLAQRQLIIWHQQQQIDDIQQRLASLKYQEQWLETIYQNQPLILEQNNQQQTKVLIILLLINAVLFILELGVGIWAKSTGLLGDALDMLADALVYGIALYAVGKSVLMQKKASQFAGFVQLSLAIILFIDIIRRYLFGSEPISTLMIIMSIIALIGNVICLYLVAQRQQDGLHMKASYIFSANDVLINLSVIIAGIAVWYFQSPLPDLLIGTFIVLIVANGAKNILFLK